MLRSIRELLLRRRYGPAVIVVSGLPRSGTSMMMNMLGAAGLELVSDRVREADEDNPKGYFEDERVKDLERDRDRSWLAGCRGKVVKIISFLLEHLPRDNHYKIIFMHRDLSEVIASQNKMLVRRGEGDARGEDARTNKLYRSHLRKVEFLLEDEPRFDRLDVQYREVIERPLEQARRVARFLGGGLDPQKMAAAVDPALYRNRQVDQRRGA